MRPIAFRDERFSSGPLQTSLKKVESWLIERCWSLHWSYSIDDCVNVDDRIITINANRTLQSQIFGILQEIGHIIIFESPDYILRFASADAHKRRSERKHETLKVKIESLGEEWEAWTNGEKFARSIGLELDYSAFHAARNRDIKTYARWVTGEI